MTNDHPMPPDLAALDAQLKAMGRVDRMRAPARLEDSVFEASRESLNAPPQVIARLGPAPASRRGSPALAAMIALIATIATVWLALPSTTAPSSAQQTLASRVELTIDDWNAVDALFSDSMGDRLDELYAESAMVSSENDESDWWDFDLTDSGSL